MSAKNIVLTGMPGSGKSTVGVILAKALVRPFIDTDLLIQNGEGRSLQSIIDSEGMAVFLETEERYVMAIRDENAVISPGGSVVLSSSAMKSLKQNGIIIFLDTPLSLIMSRIDIASRGIVMLPGKDLDQVWLEREPHYRDTADIVFDCRNMSQLEIADRLARMIETR